MAGMTVKGHRVWMGESPAHDKFWCGVEFPDPETAQDWQGFVDSFG